MEEKNIVCNDCGVELTETNKHFKEMDYKEKMAYYMNTYQKLTFFLNDGVNCSSGRIIEVGKDFITVEETFDTPNPFISISFDKILYVRVIK